MNHLFTQQETRRVYVSDSIEGTMDALVLLPVNGCPSYSHISLITIILIVIIGIILG